MKPSTTNQSHRIIRRVSVSVALAAVFVVAFTLGLWAHDTRLDEAAAALEQAEVLLQNSVYDGPDAKAQRDFDKYVSKAIDDIISAQEAIQNAMVAVD